MRIAVQRVLHGGAHHARIGVKVRVAQGKVQHGAALGGVRHGHHSGKPVQGSIILFHNLPPGHGQPAARGRPSVVVQSNVRKNSDTRANPLRRAVVSSAKQ